MPRLAVTRPKEQLADLARQAAAHGIEVVPLPVVATRPFPFLWPEQTPASSLHWVLFSSANAVSAFFNRITELAIVLPETVKFGAIGDRTAEALRARGRTVSFIPTDAYGELLFNEFVDSIVAPGEQVMYARAREVNFDPHALFTEHKIAYHPVICYETISQSVDPELVHGLDTEDYILFTAPSAVRAYHEQFGKPKARSIAIGRTTGSEMNRHGWPVVRWMNKPVIENVLEYL
jgi:uroporphyrinogen III methyltransferase / synthase